MNNVAIISFLIAALGSYGVYSASSDRRWFEAALVLLLTIVLWVFVIFTLVTPNKKPGYTRLLTELPRPLNAGSHHVEFMVPLETRRVREVQVPHVPAARQART